MLGTICKRDIVLHPVVTIRSFGLRVFFRALVARSDQTFLSLLVEADLLKPAPVSVPELVGRCFELEVEAMRIYESLAGRFAHPEAAGEFFRTLARQENDHAELLGLCRAAAQGRWDPRHLDPWRDALPRLERQMRESESALESLSCLGDALRLVIRIESSEINRVFLGVVCASDSDFVRKLSAFWTAAEDHLAYIARHIPRLEPELEEACREMLDGWSRALVGP